MARFAYTFKMMSRFGHQLQLMWHCLEALSASACINYIGLSACRVWIRLCYYSRTWSALDRTLSRTWPLITGILSFSLWKQNSSLSSANRVRDVFAGGQPLTNLSLSPNLNVSKFMGMKELSQTISSRFKNWIIWQKLGRMGHLHSCCHIHVLDSYLTYVSWAEDLWATDCLLWVTGQGLQTINWYATSMLSCH